MSCTRCDGNTRPMFPMVIDDAILRDMGLKEPIWFCDPCMREWTVSPEAKPRTLTEHDEDEDRSRQATRKWYRARIEAFIGAFRAAFFTDERR